MKDIVLVLRMCLGDEAPAPEGPGWYIYGQGESPLIPPTRVAPQAAQAIAEAFERVVVGVAVNASATPTQMVGSGNHMVRQKLQQELDEAEASASRIKGLRQSLQALQGASGTVELESERQEN